MMDDTAKIQKLLDAGGNVAVPPGTHMIDAEKSLYVRSDTVLDLSRATLQAIPNGKTKYAVLTLDGVSNVAVQGGSIRGERKEHNGKDGEWGMGIKIRGGTSSVTIADVIAADCWGDGFYIDGAANIVIRNCVGDFNRRQGLSVISVDGLVVEGCTFSNTKGTRPSDGIDLEPDKGRVISNVSITGCKFVNNAGAGIEIAGKRGKVNRVRIERNTFKGNSRSLKVSGVSSVPFWWEWVAQIVGTDSIAVA